MQRLSVRSLSSAIAMMLLTLSMGGLASTMALQAKQDYKASVARAVTMELQHATATQFAAKATIKATISIRNLPPLQPEYPTQTPTYPTPEPVIVTPQVTVYAVVVQPTATIERTVVSEVVVSGPVRGRALAVVTATSVPVATLTPVPLWLAPTQTPYVIEFPTATAAPAPTAGPVATPKPEPSIVVEPTATPQPTPGPLDSPIAIPSE